MRTLSPKLNFHVFHIDDGPPYRTAFFLYKLKFLEPFFRHPCRGNVTFLNDKCVFRLCRSTKVELFNGPALLLAAAK